MGVEGGKRVEQVDKGGGNRRKRSRVVKDDGIFSGVHGQF